MLWLPPPNKTKPELHYQLLDAGPCLFFEWPAFQGQHLLWRSSTKRLRIGPEQDSAAWLRNAARDGMTMT
eukprot:2790379-Amphidinium_carterae.1